MSTPKPVQDSDYRLLWPGTLVVQTVPGSLPRYGRVEEYEHHSVHQTTFPVRFGDYWAQMTSLDVQEREDVPQPPGRRPPRETGAWTAHNAPLVPRQRKESKPAAVAEITA